MTDSTPDKSENKWKMYFCLRTSLSYSFIGLLSCTPYARSYVHYSAAPCTRYDFIGERGD